MMENMKKGVILPSHEVAGGCAHYVAPTSCTLLARPQPCRSQQSINPTSTDKRDRRLAVVITVVSVKVVDDTFGQTNALPFSCLFCCVQTAGVQVSARSFSGQSVVSGFFVVLSPGACLMGAYRAFGSAEFSCSLMFVVHYSDAGVVCVAVFELTA